MSTRQDQSKIQRPSQNWIGDAILRYKMCDALTDCLVMLGYMSVRLRAAIKRVSRNEDRQVSAHVLKEEWPSTSNMKKDEGRGLRDMRGNYESARGWIHSDDRI